MCVACILYSISVAILWILGGIPGNMWVGDGKKEKVKEEVKEEAKEEVKEEAKEEVKEEVDSDEFEGSWRSACCLYLSAV
jgi:H+/gluconate symporter-like permease